MSRESIKYKSITDISKRKLKIPRLEFFEKDYNSFEKYDSNNNNLRS